MSRKKKHLGGKAEISVDANVLLISLERTLALTGWSCTVSHSRATETPPLPCFPTAWSEVNAKHPRSNLAGCLPRRRRRRLSARSCFPLEYCLRRLGTAVTGYFPAEENLVFDLVNTSIWWSFFFNASAEEDQSSSEDPNPAENQRWQRLAADSTPTRLAGFTGAVVENTSRPQPSGMHNWVDFLG